MMEKVAHATDSSEVTLRSAWSRFFTKRTLARLAISAVCFELVARLAPHVIPKTVHQPFLTNVRSIDAVTDGEGARQVIWRANGRGARGDLFHDENTELAVLGSSTTASTMLDQAETWPAQLAAALPCVHVDNYARDGAVLADTTRVLQRFASESRRYASVMIMQHGALDARSEAEVFNFWGRWANGDTPLVGPQQTFKQASLQAHGEERLGAFLKWLRPPPPDTNNPNTPRNWKRRHSGALKFVREQVPLGVEKERAIRQRAREMFVVAKQVSPRVYFLQQPVAYDELAVPGVSRRWYSLYPARSAPGAYLDDASIAESIRAEVSILLDEAKMQGVSLIELDDAMRPLLRERGDLYLDKWHFSRHGARAAAALVLERLRSDGMTCTR